MNQLKLFEQTQRLEPCYDDPPIHEAIYTTPWTILYAGSLALEVEEADMSTKSQIVNMSEEYINSINITKNNPTSEVARAESPSEATNSECTVRSTLSHISEADVPLTIPKIAEVIQFPNKDLGRTCSEDFKTGNW